MKKRGKVKLVPVAVRDQNAVGQKGVWWGNGGSIWCGVSGVSFGAWDVVAGSRQRACIRIPSHPLATWELQPLLFLLKRVGTTKKISFSQESQFCFCSNLVAENRDFPDKSTEAQFAVGTRTGKNKGRTQSKQTTFLAPLMQITYLPSTALRPQRLTTLVATATSTFREYKIQPNATAD